MKSETFIGNEVISNPITQAEFFSLRVIKCCQSIQKRSPYGSKDHKAAWLKICEVAEFHGQADRFNPSDY